MSSRGFMAMVLGVGVVCLLAVAVSSRRPRPAAPAVTVPATQPMVPAPAGPLQPPARPAQSPKGGPPLPPGLHMPDMNKVASRMGIAVYPGAQGGGGGWGSSGQTVTGHIQFTTAASVDQVVEFYKQQCQLQHPATYGRTVDQSRKVLVVWEQESSGRAVFVSGSPASGADAGRTVPMTRFTLLATELPVPFTRAADKPRRLTALLPPDQLGLPVYPGATIEFSGRLQTGNSQVAVARIRVVVPSAELTAFYGGSGRSVSRSGNQTVEMAGTSQGCSVNILHPDPDLPAVVWLVKK